MCVGRKSGGEGGKGGKGEAGLALIPELPKGVSGRAELGVLNSSIGRVGGQ